MTLVAKQGIQYDFRLDQQCGLCPQCVSVSVRWTLNQTIGVKVTIHSTPHTDN